jgi:predicted RecB family nuclease
MPHIDERVVSAYFLCPRKSFLLLRHRAQNSEPPPPTEYAQVLEATANKVRENYLQKLKNANGMAFLPTGGRLDEGEAFLVDVVIEVDDLCVTCPLLRKVQRPSKLGRYSYEPCLFVGTNGVPGEQIGTFRCLAHVLGQRQEVPPQTGVVITADAKLHKVKIPRVQEFVQPALKAARDWISKSYSNEPIVTLNRHCSMCQFRTDCEAKATETDDLSLLHRMTPKLMRRYQRKGIFTVNQLSYVFRPRKNRKNPRRATSQFNVELQALAIRTRKIYLHETPKMLRSPVELFLDIEGVPDRKFHYLIGVLVVDRQDSRQHSFWADGPEDEEDIWRSLVAIARQHPDAPIYHYGSYETKAIAELEARHGKETTHLNGRLVNMSKHIFGNIYFPVRSNTLKDIGRFIGARWRSEGATGLQSLAWRYKWEQTGNAEYKDRLVEYNEDDCCALRQLTSCITRIMDNATTDLEIEFSHRPKQLSNEVSRPIHTEFAQILKSAQLVYKDRRIKIQSDPISPDEDKVVRKRKAKTRFPKGRVRTFHVPPKRRCPNHPGEDLDVSRKRIAKALVTDLVFTGNGCRRVVTKYVGIKGYCSKSGVYYKPPQISKLDGKRFGDGFYAWVAYSRVVLRLPYTLISHVAQDMMGIGAPVSTLVGVFRDVSKRYGAAQKLLERRIVQSGFVHADETHLNIRGKDQYVWVFTDGEHVAFRLTETRESTVADEFLAGYKGVLISDFYPGYDGVPCRQQKCWVHLIRDINNDLWKNPFDREFENFVVEVRNLIVPIVQAVHKYGLKTRHLRKFEREVEAFYRKNIDGRHYQSELAIRFHKRFERYRDSLFVFLEVDNIPWENNMAERALRQLAVQRKISSFFFEDGALQYLRLLGLAQTCRFQDKSFLRFLLSGVRNIDDFEMKGRHGFVWPQH